MAGIRAQVGFNRRPGSYGGKPSLAVDKTLDRRFDVAAPDQAWVTDITYIRTPEGFAYLAVVIDLCSRRVVGWSMQSRQTTDVVLQALHMAFEDAACPPYPAHRPQLQTGAIPLTAPRISSLSETGISRHPSIRNGKANDFGPSTGQARLL